MVRSWELNHYHATPESEDRILLQIWPVLCVSHRGKEGIWIAGVVVLRLDALGVVCRWDCWGVVPCSSKRFSDRIGWLVFQFDKGLLKVPQGIWVELVFLGNSVFLDIRCAQVYLVQFGALQLVSLHGHFFTDHRNRLGASLT